jgi:hypothetical protein
VTWLVSSVVVAVYGTVVPYATWEFAFSSVVQVIVAPDVVGVAVTALITGSVCAFATDTIAMLATISAPSAVADARTRPRLGLVSNNGTPRTLSDSA